MKILAVSDEQSLSLETILVKKPGKYGDIDLIVSCGDLEKEYLEYIVDTLKKDFFFIRGNHLLESLGEFDGPEAPKVFQKASVKYVAGFADLHGRVEAFDDYIFTGFGGSMWYNGEYNQYTEERMSKVVKAVIRQIGWLQLRDKLLRRQRREVIVLSHAPIAGIHDQPDKTHRGFKCFKSFIDKVSPLLWLHGHIHLQNQYTNQVSKTGETTVVNVFGCKMLDINRKKIEVLAHCFKDI